MGNMHRHIWFLENEMEFAKVDDDFKETVRLINSVYGVGTYGVSCSGHFELDEKSEIFYPRPWAHLGIAVMPQVDYMEGFLGEIAQHTSTDLDARLAIKEDICPSDFKKYNVGIDLRPFSRGTNHLGNYVVELEIQLGSNGTLEMGKDYFGESLAIKDHEETFSLTKDRAMQMRVFWLNLEQKLRVFNEKHGFNTPNFYKPEFLPFR